MADNSPHQCFCFTVELFEDPIHLKQTEPGMIARTDGKTCRNKRRFVGGGIDPVV